MTCRLFLARAERLGFAQGVLDIVETLQEMLLIAKKALQMSVRDVEDSKAMIVG